MLITGSNNNSGNCGCSNSLLSSIFGSNSNSNSNFGSTTNCGKTSFHTELIDLLIAPLEPYIENEEERYELEKRLCCLAVARVMTYKNAPKIVEDIVNKLTQILRVELTVKLDVVARTNNPPVITVTIYDPGNEPRFTLSGERLDSMDFTRKCIMAIEAYVREMMNDQHLAEGGDEQLESDTTTSSSSVTEESGQTNEELDAAQKISDTGLSSSNDFVSTKETSGTEVSYGANDISKTQQSPEQGVAKDEVQKNG